MIDGVDNLKTVLDDDAELYKGEDRRSVREKWKELNGAERWQFFKDYIFAKLMWILAGVGLVVWILISMFGPKKTQILHVAVLSSPFPQGVEEQVAAELLELLSETPDDDEVILDTGYSLSVDEYNTRMKLVAVIASGEIDCIILPAGELQNEVSGGVALELGRTELGDDLLRELSEYQISAIPYEYDVDNNITSVGEEAMYALDVTEQLERICGYEFTTTYYLIITCNAPNPSNAAAFVSYLYQK